MFAHELPRSKWLLPPGLDLFAPRGSVSKKIGNLFAYRLAEGSFFYGQSMSEQPLSRMLPHP